MGGTFRKWSPEAEQALRDCFGTTDWDILQGSHSENIEEVVDCTTDYINFYMDIVVPVRTVRCYANNKPWITSDIKGLLNQKIRAFKGGDQHELKHMQKELKVQLRVAKEQYRRKLVQKLQNNSTKEVWDGMKIITGCSSKRGATIERDVKRANQMNNFFNRFDHPNPLSPRSTASSTHPSADTSIGESFPPPTITAGLPEYKSSF
ncbi:uncharacterized protein LOC127527154 [Erpetoichthys calabaricus]|uniref:uncharacterized protein LOC127527154 n=1 Tax=Erpetoichthys calabaricus TaxID=27687 RepID=UPI002234622B|nr:uncharacterized protein LOC127527154 [Erpetoichthys calabaricus]